MANGNGENGITRAARSEFLAAVARFSMIIWPMVTAPAVAYLFSQTLDNQSAIIKIEEHATNNDERIGKLETGLKELTDFIRQAREERQKEWNAIYDRLARGEEHDKAADIRQQDMVDTLRRIEEKIDNNNVNKRPIR